MEFIKHIKDVNNDVTNSSINTTTYIEESNGNTINIHLSQIFVSSKWHPGAPNVKEAIFKYKHILESNQKLADLFPDSRFVFP